VTGRWWPVLVVVAGVAIGLVVSLLNAGSWRVGAVIIGCALLVGAGIRLALPPREAGLLQVRGRAFDVAVLALGGAAVVILALAIPGR
jgi:hypothetical protein